MRYFVRIGGKELEVDAREQARGLEIRLVGGVHAVDTAVVEAGLKYSVLVDGRSFAVSVDGDGRKLALIINGRAYQVEVEDERERIGRAIGSGGASGGGVVESVMPGIVRRVEVAPGSRVKTGDRLLILEAMKMENEICAEMDGVVEKVHVADGQTVEGGAPLVTLQAPAAAGGATA